MNTESTRPKSIIVASRTIVLKTAGRAGETVTVEYPFRETVEYFQTLYCLVYDLSGGSEVEVLHLADASGEPKHVRRMVPSPLHTYDLYGDGEQRSFRGKLAVTLRFTKDGEVEVQVPGAMYEDMVSSFHHEECGADFAVETSDLKYRKISLRPYLVCSWCSKEISLSRGRGSELTEVAYGLRWRPRPKAGEK